MRRAQRGYIAWILEKRRSGSANEHESASEYAAQGQGPARRWRKRGSGEEEGRKEARRKEARQTSEQTHEWLSKVESAGRKEANGREERKNERRTWNQPPVKRTADSHLTHSLEQTQSFRDSMTLPQSRSFHGHRRL